MLISIEKECSSCKILKEQLDIANADRKQMLDTLLSLTKPEVVQAPPTIVSPVLPKTMPWHQRQRLMEEEDRNKARIQRETDKLEIELGVKEDGSADSEAK